MTNVTICDDFMSFIDDLVVLLKEDWIKFKEFIRKNKKYCMWILILLITMQFTDLLNLGTSWNHYCNKNHSIQTGGAEGVPAAPPEVPGFDAKKLAKAEDLAKKAEKKEKKDAKKKAKGKSSVMKSIKNNPVFGNVSDIVSKTSGALVIFSFVLIIIGILSIPLLVLIAITYTVLKFTVAKFTTL